MREKLWRRVREKRGFTGTQMMAASLMTLLSAVLAVQTMIFALNRTETANWTSRAQILCADASRAVQDWLSRASGVEPGLPSDGSVKEAELVCFLAADADGNLLWRAFRGGTMESWTEENWNNTENTPLLSDASDLSYRFDAGSGAYDFGPDGRGAVSIQVFCVENAIPAANGETAFEYLFRAAVSVLPVGGGEGVTNEFHVRPMLAPPMRGIQRQEAILEDMEDAENTENVENMEGTENAAEITEDTEENTDGVEAHPPALETGETLPVIE